MFKKSGLKKCIISTLAIIFGLSALSTNVMAATPATTGGTYIAAENTASKEITVTVTRSTPSPIPGGEIGGFFNSLFQTTYYYDDGSYQGTLYFLNYSNWKILRAAGQDSFLVITDVEYTGIVTSY